MGFYGALLGLTALFAAVMLAGLSYRMSMLGNFSNEFSSYINMEKIETFESLMGSAPAQGNVTVYNSWLNSLYVSARTDGINITASNGVMIISTKSRPAVSAILRTD